MKLVEIFRFEMAYRLRRLSTWFYFVVLFGVGFLVIHAIDGGSGHVNAPVNVASFTIMFGILGVLVTAALFGDSATRDVQSRIHPLFYTAPLTKTDYLGGRFAANLAVNALLLTGIPLGLAIGAGMPYLAAEMFGPFRPAAYLQPYLVFLLPSLFLTAAILFTIAALTQSVLPSYLGGIGIFIVYILADEIYDRMGNRDLAVLLDPFGISVMDHRTAYWTPVERNTRLLPIDDLIVWNRLIWIAVGIALLAFLFLRFRFAHPTSAGGKRRARLDAADNRPEAVRPLVVPAVSRAFDLPTRLRQMLAITGRSFREVVRTRPFLGIVAGSLVWVFGFGWDVGGVVFGTSMWPVTHLIAGTVLSGSYGLGMVISLLIAVYAGELTIPRP